MEAFKLMGIKLKGKTTNENGQSEKDCGALWQKFEADNIAAAIPHKISDTVYAVYYDYESDENGLFSYFIGCQVDENAVAPEGLDEIIIPQQNYHVERAKGQMTGCIADAWRKIWNAKINRQYGYDFEVYDERSRDWNNAEIDIFLSIKD